MSDRDFMNLSDDVLDDGVGGSAGEWDDDLLGGFPDDDPAADDVVSPVAPPLGKAAPAKTKTPRKRQ